MNWVKFDDFWYNLDCYETVYVETCVYMGRMTFYINGRLSHEKDEEGEHLIHALSDEYDTKEEAQEIFDKVMSRFE